MSFYSACVLLTVFGGFLAAFDVALLLGSAPLLRALARVSSTRRPEAILVMRFLPMTLALAVTLCVFVPAWWMYEPVETGEEASVMLVLAAAASLLPLVLGGHRALRMFMNTRDRMLGWRERGRHAAITQTPFEVVEVNGHDVSLCVGGYLTPTIYASKEVLESLEPEELHAALAHETSHATSRDPLRLLSMGACPDFLQVLGLDRAWRRAFSQACEFAADVRASRGDRGVALDLASALLKVARLNSVAPLRVDAMDIAVSSAFHSRADLEARVQALANPDAAATRLPFSPRLWITMALALLTLAGFSSAERVHALTERVGRTLAP